MFVFIVAKSHIHNALLYIIVSAGYNAGIITLFLYDFISVH